jgi:uncharacterized protein YukE
MFEALKPLIEGGLLNEEAQAQLEEAWELKVSAIREEVETEMRSEFANRYEHDKAKMVEALDRMVTESLTSEIGEIAQEKAKVAEDRVKTVAKLSEQSANFENFLTKVLAKEIKEFRDDRTANKEALVKLESFVAEGLSKELTEFHEDKQDLIATKVKLVAEAKGKFVELKKNFITRSGKAISEAVDQTLRAEISQLKEDIAESQKNNFGRKLFEAFASEFSATHLNENAEMRKLKNSLDEIKQSLEEAKKVAEEKSAIAESKDVEIAAINESIAREKTINELLSPLSKDRARVMSDLLESVGTSKLKTSFDKYLPAVMNGNKSTMLNESKQSITSEVTGNRTAKVLETNDEGNIVEIKRLAGL